MRSIYQQAWQVIVWLGPEDETSALALRTMEQIFDECCLSRFGLADRCTWLDKVKAEYEGWHDSLEDFVPDVSIQWPESVDACTHALQAFFGRQWFSRVWVIQEVRGCRQSIARFGNLSVAWDIIAVAAAWVVYGTPAVTHINEPYKFRGFLHADLMRRRTLKTPSEVPFPELLDRCRGFKCTIDKDRIFALLQHPAAQLNAQDDGSLSSTVRERQSHDDCALHLGLTVDYNVSLFELYKAVVLSSIIQGRSLLILSHATEGPEDREIYPSWMPVWHGRGDARHIGPRRSFLYSAGSRYEVQLRLLPEPRLIGLAGVVVGTIMQTSTNFVLAGSRSESAQVISSGITLSELQKAAKLFVRDCWQPQDNWVQKAVVRTSAKWDVAFADFCAFLWERLRGKCGSPMMVSLHGKWCNICGKRHVASLAEGSETRLDILHCNTCFDFDLCLWCSEAGHTCPGQHILEPRPLPSMFCDLDQDALELVATGAKLGDSMRYDTGVRQTFDGKHFVKLDDGLLGVAPENTRNGDIVVVFFGGRVPFVLRRKGEFHTIIGECYVQGIMDGEAMDDWRSGKLQKKDFILE